MVQTETSLFSSFFVRNVAVAKLHAQCHCFSSKTFRAEKCKCGGSEALPELYWKQFWEVFLGSFSRYVIFDISDFHMFFSKMFEN